MTRQGPTFHSVHMKSHPNIANDLKEKYLAVISIYSLCIATQLYSNGKLVFNKAYRPILCVSIPYYLNIHIYRYLKQVYMTKPTQWPLVAISKGIRPQKRPSEKSTTIALQEVNGWHIVNQH